MFEWNQLFLPVEQPQAGIAAEWIHHFLCPSLLIEWCMLSISIWSTWIWSFSFMCESFFLPPIDSPWAHVSIEYTGASAHACGRPGLGSQSLLRAYRQIYTPIIGTWDSGQLWGSCSYNRVTEREHPVITHTISNTLSWGSNFSKVDAFCASKYRSA